MNILEAGPAQKDQVDLVFAVVSEVEGMLGYALDVIEYQHPKVSIASTITLQGVTFNIEDLNAESAPTLILSLMTNTGLALLPPYEG